METALKESINKIVTEYGPVEKIILFGSRARGEADEYSDTDLIIIKDTPESFIKRLSHLPFLSVQTDVFVYTPAEFEAMKASGNSFIMQALSNSKVVYSQDEG